ncbi:glutamyl-tRNA reductase [Calditrichota bacterium]
MNLSACFISHKTSSLKERSPYQIPKEDLAAAIKSFQHMSGLTEAAIIVTCNRVEFYCADNKKQDMLSLVEQFYSDRMNTGIFVRAKWQVRQGSSVARHLFKVTSGLDSAVLGEYQVINQVKEAYSSACAVNGAGKYLHKLFHQAFQISKRIRSDYHFSDGAQGFGGAAVDIILERSDIDWSKAHLTVIGINELTEHIIDRLQDRFAQITLVNRTLYKAEKLARTIHAESASLEELGRIIAKTDVLVSSTSAQGYVVGADTFRTHKDTPILIIDLAFPCDVDPIVCSRKEVSLYDLDDIKAHLSKIEYDRVEVLPEALQTVEEQVLAFEAWRGNILNGNHADLRKVMEKDRIELTNKFSSYFKDGEKKALEAFSRNLYKQFLRRINSESSVKD